MPSPLTSATEDRACFLLFAHPRRSEPNRQRCTTLAPRPPSPAGLPGRSAPPTQPQGSQTPAAFHPCPGRLRGPGRGESLTAIAEWAADAPPTILARLGGPCRDPQRGSLPTCEATVRRVLQRIDGDALDTVLGTWLAKRNLARPTADDSDRRCLAVDGKTVRGARPRDGTQVHLLAAMTGTGLITAQREVDSKTNEITVFKPCSRRAPLLRR